MKKIELIIKTWVGGGKFKHQVYEKGINAKNRNEFSLSSEVVEAQQKVNERVYQELPEYSKNLVVSKIEYEI
jgi:hypothetical protein